MDGKAKSCPKCGAPHKKPLYTKWWFWLVIIVILGGISNSGKSGAVDPLPSSKAFSAAASGLESKTYGKDEESKAHSSETIGQKNALKSAQSYLSFAAFSYEGLIEQLEFEEYSREDAVYAADHCGADWNEQAAKSAASYLKYSSFSRQGLIEQLEFEGFTHSQAVYGVEANGY